MSSMSKSENCQPLEDTCASSQSNNRRPSPALANPVSSSSSDHNCDGGTSKSKNTKGREEEFFGDGNFCGGNCGKKKLRERSERYLQLWTNTDKYGGSHDVTFEVGSEKMLITAHQIILQANCLFFDDLFSTRITNSRMKPLPFPELDPVAFKQTLQYIYSNTITMTGSTPKEIFDILHASSLFGLSDLGTLCRAALRLQIDSDNVVEMLHLAHERNEKRMEELTRNHISNHIRKVFLSPRFLQLSEDALCSLLNLDEWHLDEVEVFEHVKRWSSSKLVFQSGGVNSGEQMKAAMGQAFFGIRFPLMTEDEFYQQVFDKHEGFFSREEIEELCKYFYNLRKNLSTNCLKRFTSRPRLHQASPLSSAAVDDNAEETSPTTDIDRSDIDHKMEIDAEQLSGGDTDNNVSLSSVSIIQEDPELMTPPPPPPKKSRIENPHRVGTNHSEESTTVQNYVNDLEKRNDKENIEVIEETLHFYTLPRNRVHLPQLTEFRLRLKLNKSFEFERGLEFMEYVHEKTEKLDQLLFFDKALPNASKFSNSSENNLKILLSQKVNISIHVEDCLILKVNHDDGKLIMNMLACAQEIINSLHDFPLKMLAINHCQLSSLQGLRQDLLETVVLNCMEGLEHSVKFLDTCPFLREIACDSLFTETGRNRISLQRLLSKHEHLEKVSFAQGTLSFVASPRSRGRHSSLRELYLSLSNCSYELGSFGSYPNLNRVCLSHGDDESCWLFYDIMKTESLEWIFVEGITLNRTTEKVLSDEARVVHNFLSEVFNYDTQSESDWEGFILEKKPSQKDEQSGTSKSTTFAAQKYDPFDASKWKGEEVAHENRATIQKKLIFEHFSYNLFHADYETFDRIEFDENGRI